MPRADYAADPALLGRVLELLGGVFGPGFRQRERQGRCWGLRWERCSLPFVHVERDQVVAHVGVMSTTAVLDGVRRSLGALHAVAVDPSYRGRGLMRALMGEALAWCDSRFEACALAGAPALYERFGFRPVPEHRFVGRAPRGGRPARAPLRCCRVDEPADPALWRRLLTARAPVSERAGIVADVDVFCFNTAGRPIWHSPGLDALLDLELEGRTLRLYDVVAASMPCLADLVAALAAPVERVEVYFAPDRLDAELDPEPFALGTAADPDTWMVRGPWTRDPFLWPRTARW